MPLYARWDECARLLMRRRVRHALRCSAVVVLIPNAGWSRRACRCHKPPPFPALKPTHVNAHRLGYRLAIFCHLKPNDVDGIMGRRPNQLILEYFERGPKLEDASNRYQHTCKSCGERFAKGRIDSLTSHLVREDSICRCAFSLQLTLILGEKMSRAAPP